MTNTKKLRVSQLIVEIPVEESPVFVRIVIQRVVKNADYETIQTVDRVDAINRIFSQYGTNIHTFNDPVLGTILRISGAGLGNAIGEFTKAWMLEDIENTTRNERGDIVEGE